MARKRKQNPLLREIIAEALRDYDYFTGKRNLIHANVVLGQIITKLVERVDALTTELSELRQAIGTQAEQEQLDAIDAPRHRRKEEEAKQEAGEEVELKP